MYVLCTLLHDDPNEIAFFSVRLRESLLFLSLHLYDASANAKWMSECWKSTKKFVDKTESTGIDNVHVGLPILIDGQEWSQQSLVYCRWKGARSIFQYLITLTLLMRYLLYVLGFWREVVPLNV